MDMSTDIIPVVNADEIENGEQNVVDDDDDVDDVDDEDEKDEHTKDIHLPCLLDTVVNHETGDSNILCGDNLFLDDSYYSTHSTHSLGPNTWNNEPAPISLVVADHLNSSRLRQVISPCLVDHELHDCDYDQAYEMCSKTAYYMIWLYLGNPASQEILGFTTSIRYATKTNRNTIIVGVTPTKLDVDLGLHGLAEVVVEPITKPYILSKYRNWACISSVALREKSEKEVSSTQPTPPPTFSSLPGENVNDNDSVTSASSTWLPTPETAVNEIVPSNMMPTNILEEKKTASKSTIKPLKLMTAAQKLTREAMAADHTTKEKLRRERIKDSCDQLRVLLPYIRGRKTDMASILEMTVDYLKLITNSLPPEFQTQITTLMGKMATEEPRSKSESARSSTRRNTRRSSMENPESPSVTKVSSTSELSKDDNCPISMMDGMIDINGNLTPTSTRKSISETIPTSPSYTNLKRCESLEATDVKPAKRMLMTPSSVPSSQSSMLYMPADNDNRKDSLGLDNSHDDPFHIHVPQSHLYGDMDRLYSMPGYSQLTGSANPRLAALDRDSYGLFMDTYYHYYTGQQVHNSGYAGNGLSDYVNPNAVLPVTYSSRSYDDTDRFSTSATTDDVYLSSNANQT